MDGNGGSHYFDHDQSVPVVERTYEIEGPDGPLVIVSGAGVFSHGSLDKATALLLEVIRTLPEPPPGDILDLGCGAGPVAVLLAARFPSRTVRAVDSNARAVELCARSAARNGLGNIVASLPGEVPDGTRFSLVCSNPPIRVGKTELHRILAHWLGMLTHDGTARMVVGRNLGADSLQEWLTANGWPTERTGSSKGFRLLRSVVRAAGG